MADEPKIHVEFSGVPLRPTPAAPPPAAPPKKRWLPVKSIVTLLIIGVIVWMSSTYYYNFFFGPFLYDDAALLAAAKEPGNGLIAYIKLTGHPVVASGIEEVMTRNGKKAYSHPYLLTAVGDKLLVVMAESTVDRGELVGPIFRVPEDVQTEVIDKLTANNPAARDRFLPIMLNDAAAYKVIGYIGLAVLIPLALLCIGNIVLAGVRRTKSRGA